MNTAQVDDPVTPTLVLEGPGSTGASLRQTVLGIDARGPRVFNARTHADVRVDFDGASLSNSTASSYAGGLLRLRTAHASLNWEHTEAFFSLDQAIVAPTSQVLLLRLRCPRWHGRAICDLESPGRDDAGFSVRIFKALQNSGCTH